MLFVGCLPLPGTDVAIFLVLEKIKPHYCVIFSGVIHAGISDSRFWYSVMPALLTKQPQLLRVWGLSES